METVKTRAYQAGKKLATAIIEMVHLMYQNKTALNFYAGLHEAIIPEINRRLNNDKDNN